MTSSHFSCSSLLFEYVIRRDQISRECGSYTVTDSALTRVLNRAFRSLSIYAFYLPVII